MGVDIIGVKSARRTYRASGNLVAAVTANAPFLDILGAAGKVIRLTRIKIHAPTLTAVQLIRIAVAKYSTAISGGTSTNPNKVPLDSQAQAAAAVVAAYTVAPTPGTLVGQLSERSVLAQATTPAAGAPYDEGDFDWSYAEMNTEFPTLRGIAEHIGVIFPVAPASAVTFSYMIEWTEDGN